MRFFTLGLGVVMIADGIWRADRAGAAMAAIGGYAFANSVIAIAIERMAQKMRDQIEKDEKDLIEQIEHEARLRQAAWN